MKISFLRQNHRTEKSLLASRVAANPCGLPHFSTQNSASPFGLPLRSLLGVSHLRFGRVRTLSTGQLPPPATSAPEGEARGRGAGRGKGGLQFAVFLYRFLWPNYGPKIGKSAVMQHKMQHKFSQKAYFVFSSFPSNSAKLMVMKVLL